MGTLSGCYIIVLTMKRAAHMHSATVFVVGVVVGALSALEGIAIILHGRRRQEYEAARQAVALGGAGRARFAAEPLPSNMPVPPLPSTIGPIGNASPSSRVCWR